MRRGELEVKKASISRTYYHKLQYQIAWHSGRDGTQPTKQRKNESTCGNGLLFDNGASQPCMDGSHPDELWIMSNCRVLRRPFHRPARISRDKKKQDFARFKCCVWYGEHGGALRARTPSAFQVTKYRRFAGSSRPHLLAPTHNSAQSPATMANLGIPNLPPDYTPSEGQLA